MEATTPGNNPETIDRGGLIGVGDLATPRWASRTESVDHSKAWKAFEQNMREVSEENDTFVQHQALAEALEDQDNDVDRSSPWTIEAVDESDTNEPSYVSTKGDKI